jgi:aldehyde dehydrogenase family 7 protein A1
MSNHSFLKELGFTGQVNKGCYRRGEWVGDGPVDVSINPHDNFVIGKTATATVAQYNECIEAMEEERARWVQTPAPVRGEIVRQIGDALRLKKDALGQLLTLEMGKIRSEGLGEVQEFIDICDMAVGMSRTFDGKVIPSERPGHFMIENWNPIGNVGVITAFNFPVAVCGWNAALALICGDTVIWKGAQTTSLTSCALGKVMVDVLAKHGFKSVLTVCCGDGVNIGNSIVKDPRIPLVSFTGSTAVGRGVSRDVHERFGRTILELGGNNATIVMPDADQEIVFQGSIFAAVGTCGQRCTSLRRLMLHESVYDAFVQRMIKTYAKLNIGNPFDKDTLVGPLHSKTSVKNYVDGLEEIKK